MVASQQLFGPDRRNEGFALKEIKESQYLENRDKGINSQPFFISIAEQEALVLE